MPVSDVRTWSRFILETTETSKDRAKNLIEGLNPGKKYGNKINGRYYPLLDPFISTDGFIDWQRMFKEYELEYTPEGLPPTLQELETTFLTETVPKNLSLLLNRLVLGNSISDNKPNIKGGPAMFSSDVIPFHSTLKTQSTKLAHQASLAVGWGTAPSCSR